MHGKAIATLALAAACIYWMYVTEGVSGIGWFILGLLIIW